MCCRYHFPAIMLPIILILILTYLLMHRMVTSTGPYICRPVESTYGRAVGITLRLGATPFHNSVTGKIVCNGLTEPSDVTHQLPTMYCPRAFGGNLAGVKRVIDQVCRGAALGQAFWQEVSDASTRIARRRNNLRSPVAPLVTQQRLPPHQH